MSHAELLSARIAALEASAGGLPDLYRLRENIVLEIQRQQDNLADVDRKIAQGQGAQLALQHLAEQAERVLSAGAAFQPEPEQQADDSATADQAPAVQEAVSPDETEPVVSEGSDEQKVDAEPHAPNIRERVEAWVEQQQGGRPFQVPEVAAALGLAQSTVASYLSALTHWGALERQPGTGKPGKPSIYSRVTPASVTPPVVPAEPAPPAGETEPGAAQQMSEAAQQEPQLDTAPSLRDRVLTTMNRDPELAWTSEELAGELDVLPSAISAVVSGLVRSRTIERVPGTAPTEYRIPASQPATPAPAPAATLSLPAIPERLSTDERSAYDALRREQAGLTRRVLQARLNWAGSRLDRVVGALERAGHLGRNGDHLRVAPPELAEGAA